MGPGGAGFGKSNPHHMPDVDITIRPSGPYLIRGPISLHQSDGTPIDLAGKEVVALCRCGGSTTKPFCDGTHSTLGFEAATQAVKESS
jgi:CDGSH-type Zn-finger protein